MVERTQDLGIYFLDVGQGDATVVLPPEGEGGALVFDCRDDVVVTKLLDHWQVKKLHALILSHLDWDHIAGARQLLRHPGLEIERVQVSLDRELLHRESGGVEAKALLRALVDGHDHGRWEFFGAHRDPRPVAQGADWNLTLLAPEFARTVERETSGSWEDPNRMSSVLRVERAGTVVLVGGDAPLATWAEIPAQERKARVFRIPHHGGRLDDGGVPESWSVDRLYSEVGAEDAAVSVGTRNGYGHPDRDWIAPLLEGACRLRCTQVTERCQVGVCEDAEVHQRNVLAHPFLVEPHWRHCQARGNGSPRKPEVPCAGTVVVSIAPDGRLRIRPEASTHSRVVDDWSNPLCRPSP